MADPETEPEAPAGEAVPGGLRPVADLDPQTRPPAFERRADGATVLRAERAGGGGWVFPPATPGAATEPVGPGGTLYSFTTVRVSSSRPVPYRLGYVDFPEGLRVLSLVRGDAEPACDAPVTLRSDDRDWWVEPAAQEGRPS